MPGGEPTGAGTRTITYCVVPFDLAGRLHEPLRRHFAADPAVEVVVERRAVDRRSAEDRRGDEASPDSPLERRRIHAATGRRVADRRAPLIDVVGPPLPRAARRHAERLVFVERLEPTELQAEDVDTARLVARFQAGDADVFPTIYLRYFDRVFSYLRTVLRDSHSAEDVAQEIFVRVLVHLPSYERRSQPFRGWLFTVVRNQAIDEMRRRRWLQAEDPATLDRRREAEEPDESALEVIDWLSDRELMLFVERLPVAQREVLLMRFMLGLTHTEVAHALGLTAVNVRKLQHRALAFLRERLTAIGRAPERREPRRGSVHRPVQARVARRRRFALLS
jgi:RNA polymerase sigma-70 factor (ECF subfamily)